MPSRQNDSDWSKETRVTEDDELRECAKREPSTSCIYTLESYIADWWSTDEASHDEQGCDWPAMCMPLICPGIWSPVAVIVAVPGSVEERPTG